MISGSKLIQVFLKSPESGKVKTRLIPDLGVTRATDLHIRLCNKVLAVVSTCGAPVECWVSGDISHPFIQDLSSRHKLCSQAGIDLGERMYNALLFGLQKHTKVILVGADAYSLTADYIKDAFEQLEHHDVVLGPAADGGYILVGAKRLHPNMFSDIDWGTDLVLKQQLENVSRCLLSCFLLETRWDIDELQDIQEYAPELLNDQ